MSDAMTLARRLAGREPRFESMVSDTAVEKVRIAMEDGSRLELVSNRLGGAKPNAVTFARLTSTGWDLEDPDAGFVWRVHPAGSDERPDLMSAVEE